MESEILRPKYRKGQKVKIKTISGFETEGIVEGITTHRGKLLYDIVNKEGSYFVYETQIIELIKI